MEEAERYSFNILRALHSHVRRMAPVHCSEKKFSSVIRSICILPLEHMETAETQETFEDALTEAIDAQRFLQSLQPQEQTVLQMKLGGYTQREIASSIRSSESRVSRISHGIRHKYLLYLEDSDRAK